MLLRKLKHSWTIIYIAIVSVTIVGYILDVVLLQLLLTLQTALIISEVYGGIRLISSACFIGAAKNIEREEWRLLLEQFFIVLPVFRFLFSFFIYHFLLIFKRKITDLVLQVYLKSRITVIAIIPLHFYVIQVYIP